MAKRTYACELSVKFGGFDRGQAQTRRSRAFVFVGVTISGTEKGGSIYVLELEIVGLYLKIGVMFAAISKYEKEGVIEWWRSVKY